MTRRGIPHRKTLFRNPYYPVSRKDNLEMITKHIAKFVVAVALTLATIIGSGVVAEQIGLEVGASAYACGGNIGGGC